MSLFQLTHFISVANTFSETKMQICVYIYFPQETKAYLNIAAYLSNGNHQVSDK